MMKQAIELLKKSIEQKFQREMKTPRDFKFLSEHIQEICQASISATTLKRLWGYLPNENTHQPQAFTLEVLAKTAGYEHWSHFLNSIQNICDSDFIHNEYLDTSTLKNGEVIELQWNPDRNVSIRHGETNTFTVLSSHNSKLSVGDTFRVSHIMQGKPLQVYELVHNGSAPMNYICGIHDGVRFKRL